MASHMDGVWLSANGGSDGCFDLDGDGYGTGPQCMAPDCDDEDPEIHTALPCLVHDGWASCVEMDICAETCPENPEEICDNGIDEDCDGQDELCEEGCADGPIPSSGCLCAGDLRFDGYCCDGEHKVNECLCYEEDTLVCENFEDDDESVNIDENECDSWDCHKPTPFSIHDGASWTDWWSLGEYCSWDDCTDLDGIVDELAHSGTNALKLTNDPEHEDISGQHGEESPFPKIRYPAQPANQSIYVRAYVKWGDGYDCNYGIVSTGKGLYLHGSGSLNFQLRKGDFWYGGGQQSGPWGNFSSEDEAFAVMTYYKADECPSDECILVHQTYEPGECESVCDEAACEALSCSALMNGMWHTIEYMADQATDTVALWIDGAKHFEYTDLPDFSIDSTDPYVELTNYYHHGPPHLQSMYWDDIVVSRSYIGPTRCPNGEEITGACYCGEEPDPEDASNILTEGVCWE